jgi:hypothetical protein
MKEQLRTERACPFLTFVRIGTGEEARPFTKTSP